MALLVHALKLTISALYCKGCLRTQVLRQPPQFVKICAIRGKKTLPQAKPNPRHPRHPRCYYCRLGMNKFTHKDDNFAPLQHRMLPMMRRRLLIHPLYDGRPHRVDPTGFLAQIYFTLKSTCTSAHITETTPFLDTPMVICSVNALDFLTGTFTLITSSASL